MREIRLSRSEGGGVIHLALPTPIVTTALAGRHLFRVIGVGPKTKALRHRAGRFRGHSLVQNPRSEKLDCGYHFGCRCRGAESRRPSISEVDTRSELEGAASRAGVVRLDGHGRLAEQGIGNVAALLCSL